MSPCPPLIITRVCPWLINHLSDPWNFNKPNGILFRSNWRKPYPKFYGLELLIIKGSSRKLGGRFINPVLALYIYIIYYIYYIYIYIYYIYIYLSIGIMYITYYMELYILVQYFLILGVARATVPTDPRISILNVIYWDFMGGWMGFNWICAGYNYSQQFMKFECVPKWWYTHFQWPCKRENTGNTMINHRICCFIFLP